LCSTKLLTPTRANFPFARLQRHRERFVPRKIVVVWIDHTNKSQMMAAMRPLISFGRGIRSGF